MGCEPYHNNLLGKHEQHLYIIHNEWVCIWNEYTDACSHRLLFSYGSHGELCLNKDYNVWFPLLMVGGEERLPKDLWSVFKPVLALMKCRL